MFGSETPRPQTRNCMTKPFKPAPDDAGIIPGGIRDRAMRAIGFDVPSWWYSPVGEVGGVGDFEIASQASVACT
jgi:hypothetical protein